MGGGVGQGSPVWAGCWGAGAARDCGSAGGGGCMQQAGASLFYAIKATHSCKQNAHANRAPTWRRHDVRVPCLHRLPPFPGRPCRCIPPQRGRGRQRAPALHHVMAVEPVQQHHERAAVLAVRDLRRRLCVWGGAWWGASVRPSAAGARPPRALPTCLPCPPTCPPHRTPPSHPATASPPAIQQPMHHKHIQPVSLASAPAPTPCRRSCTRPPCT